MSGWSGFEQFLGDTLHLYVSLLHYENKNEYFAVGFAFYVFVNYAIMLVHFKFIKMLFLFSILSSIHPNLKHNSLFCCFLFSKYLDDTFFYFDFLQAPAL